MAFNNGPRIRSDRFGNAYQLKTAEAVVNKDGVLIDGAYKCYVELGGKLYKIEISNREKETKSGKPAKWVKVTLSTKRQAPKSM